MSHFPCFNFGIRRTQPPSLSVGESDCTATVDSLIFLQFHLPYHDRKVSQKATESILERLKFKNLLGGMPPDPPSHCTFCRARIALSPPTENKEPPHSRIRLRAWCGNVTSYRDCWRTEWRTPLTIRTTNILHKHHPP